MLIHCSKTALVAEVTQNGKNGLWVDFFSPDTIADRVDEVLGHGDPSRFNKPDLSRKYPARL